MTLDPVGIELNPVGVELSPDEMVEQAKKRAPLIPNVMALLLATLEVMTQDQLLKLMSLSSTTIQIGIEMGLDHDLFMQLMEQGWTVLKREEVEDTCQDVEKEHT